MKCKLLFTSKDPREALVSTYKYYEYSAGMFLLPTTATDYLYDDLILFYISTCLDKYAFSLICKKHNIPAIPSFLKIEENNDKRFVVKERYGSGSKNIGIDLSYEDAIQYAKELENPI